MCVVNLRQVLENCTFPEAGNKLYAILSDNIGNDEQIVINMEGVSSLPSLFLNTSFGQYIQKNGKSGLRKV